MRNAGYNPDRFQTNADETSFHRLISGAAFPRFHAYCTIRNNELIINLHLDQKAPSYSGVKAHSGEYEGPTLETEMQRIQSLAS